MSTLKVNTIQNASGVEKYLCQAWVNFNGTGTVAIRASGNVSSITDNGTGQYTINFTTALPDVNYAVVGSGALDSVVNRAARAVNTVGPYNTTSMKINTVVDSGSNDLEFVNVAIFR